MSQKSKLVLILIAAVLLVAMVVSFRSQLTPHHILANLHLVRDLPVVAGGYTITDQPIASTPEMQKAVNEMLNYDEAVFRTYSGNGISFSVYAAYWSPGRFHPRLISIHTPDVCWLGNGMTQVKADFNYQLKIDGKPLWYGQYREFTANGVQTNVVYWHILNGKLSGYAEGPNSLSQDFFATMWRDMHEGIGEQYFIRISSPVPFVTLLRDPIFIEVLRHFEPVLLASD